MKKGIIIIVSFIFILVIGCTPKINVQLEGRPVPNYVNRANLLNSGIQIETALIKYYGTKEGDELLSTYEYLALGTEKPHKINIDNTQRLKVMVLVHNPQKEKYSMWIEYSIDKDGGVSLSRHTNEPVYEGSLSRKEFNFDLPLQNGVYGYARFMIYDKDLNIIYESPKASYTAMSKREGTYDAGFQVK
jgi:hypothetical protein